MSLLNLQNVMEQIKYGKGVFLGWYSISLSLNACKALCMCLLFVGFLFQLQ